MLVSGKCHEAYQNYQQRIAANNEELFGGSPPDFSEDGSYKSKQYNPLAASCWCVNIETGVKIPGTEKKTFIANIDCSEYKGILIILIVISTLLLFYLLRWLQGGAYFKVKGKEQY